MRGEGGGATQGKSDRYLGSRWGMENENSCEIDLEQQGLGWEFGCWGLLASGKLQHKQQSENTRAQQLQKALYL